jgi:hypothetical protein
MTFRLPIIWKIGRLNSQGRSTSLKPMCVFEIEHIVGESVLLSQVDHLFLWRRKWAIGVKPLH